MKTQPSITEFELQFLEATKLLFESSADYDSFLEGKMRKYVDYANIPTKENGEAMVPIDDIANVRARQIGQDMRKFTGDAIYVREAVLGMLVSAGELLQEKLPGSELQVVYGYRADSIQRGLFERIKAEKLASGFDGSEAELLEVVHRMVAVPSVAGHPTGGAIDIQIARDGDPLNFGTPIWDFDDADTYTFSPNITPLAWANRQLLRGVMMPVGFTPFDGEWWHFSYGDPEWAAATNAQSAIYDQIEFRVMTNDA